MLRKHSEKYKLLYKLFDSAIIVVSLLVSYYLKFNTLTLEFQYLILTIGILACWFIINSHLMTYETQRSRPLSFDIRLLIKSMLILLCIISPILFYFNRSFSRVSVFTFFIISFILFLILRIGVRIMLKYLRSKGYNTRNLLIVGGGSIAKMILSKVDSHPEFGYQDPIIVVDDIKDKSLTPLWKGKTRDLEKIIEENNIDDVIIAYPAQKKDKVISLIDRCERIGVRIRIVPDMFRMIHERAVIEDFDGLPLIGLQTEPLLSLWNRFIKRSFDIIFSLSVLTLLSPLYLIIAAVIKLTSRGPVLFSQKRIGANNKKFTIYKFRTMAVQKINQSDTTWTTTNDQRITAVGKFLRKMSLDELPQFFNVIKGDMSVVGPRPEREHFVKQFSSEIQLYRLRHLVNVGITGWAQVNGLRGDTSISERIKYDNYYIRNWSFWLDIKIIFMTLFSGHKNAI